jgi:hypothetical protein
MIGIYTTAYVNYLKSLSITELEELLYGALSNENNETLTHRDTDEYNLIKDILQDEYAAWPESVTKKEEK